MQGEKQTISTPADQNTHQPTCKAEKRFSRFKRISFTVHLLRACSVGEPLLHDIYILSIFKHKFKQLTLTDMPNTVNPRMIAAPKSR